MKLPTLYGKSKNGKIKQWTISVLELGDGTCYIETEHGYIDGKKQFDSRLVSEGKNLGKANETSPREQADSEAQSAFNRKKDEGYVESVAGIQSASEGTFLPMLAHRYDKHSAEIKFPCFGQPKLDGLRLLAMKVNGKVTVWSRKGKPLDILHNIESQLTSLLKEGQSVDGEVYVHGWTFQRIMSAAKKDRADTALLEYHIYDLPHKTLAFSARMPIKHGDEVPVCSEYNSNFKDMTPYPNIKLVDTRLINDEGELREFESKCIAASYEGAMARNANSKYVFKYRSYDLQKLKTFVDGEYEIIGGKEGEGREAGMVIFRCKTKDGSEFDVRPVGTHEARTEMFNNLASYIGKELTVKYQEFSESGIPRFPVGLRICESLD